MSPLPELPEVIELIRPDDLLNLRIVPTNLRLERDPPTEAPAGQNDAAEIAPVSLVVDDPGLPALLRVIFPPQHIAEFAAFESDPNVKDDSNGDKVHENRENAKQTEPGADENKPLGTLDPDPPPLPGTGVFKARIAAASRLVFRVAAGRRIPYTVAGLLDWRGLEPLLHPLAALGEDVSEEERAAAPPISAPTVGQTALELPYRLLISPGNAATWAHRTQPFGAHGRYELWHTRLVTTKDPGFNELDVEHPAPLRALWSPDYRPDQKPEDHRNREGTGTIGAGTAGRSALSDDDRHQIVVLTSAFHGYETDRLEPVFFASRAGLDRAIATPSFIDFNLGPAPYVPEPFRVSQLMLSPLGGWLKSGGAWKPPRKAGATKPTKRPDIATSKGLRELYQPFVRVDRSRADPGRFMDLARFDFIPDSIKSTGEQLDLSEWIHVATQGRDHYVRVAYEGELWPFRHKASLVKVTERKFVQRPDRLILACLVQRVFILVREPEKIVDRNDSPLKKVRLTTRVTPNLTEPAYLAGTTRSFWVNVGAKPGEKFRFHAVGTDQDGREVDCTIPLIFASITDTAKSKQAIDAAYNDAVDRAADFMGAQVAFTPLDGSDSPLLATRAVLFAADTDNRPPFLKQASVTIPALASLLGKDDAVRIAYDDTGANGYATHGFIPANATGVFAKLVDTLPLGFRADQAGGFATPNQTLTALSRAHGPVAGDIGKAMADSFDPASVFPQSPIPDVPSLPLLFGTFGLDKLLKVGSLSAQAPKIVTVREGNAIVTILDWQPELESPVDVEVVKFIKKGNTDKLDIHGETRVPVGSGKPSSVFEGKLQDFDIVLLDSVTIHFTEFAFNSRNGETPAVKVALDASTPLEFSGDLQFVEELRKAIPPGLFGDGASLSITPPGIRAGFAIGLPPLEIGVFALKDVSLGAALTLPFLDGKPILDFNVSDRASPFQLRVAFFAGGGFFHLQMDTLGMRQLEVALEFGAAFGLSIAVATGEVHAMAGIYFAIVRKDLPDVLPVGSSKNICTLTGFMRLGGRLSVIGLIRLSVEFNLSFTYQSESDKAYGRATVTVMVEVLFVSVSVSLTVERAFGGSADPVFLQTFPERETWREYASAFA